MSQLHITTIQANLAWENKEANLHSFTGKIRGIVGRKEIVVLPEMFTTGFSMRPEALAETMDGPTVSWMRNMAREQRIILTGSLIIEETGRYYNRLVWMLPNGTYGYYDKKHLFACGGEHHHYVPGEKRFIASVNGWRVNLLICYDLRFPVWARQQPAAGDAEYDLLICVANWPVMRNHAWKTLLQARAIENQCYVVGVNRVGTDGNGVYHSGDTMVADPLGEVLYHITGKEEVHTTVIDKAPLLALREKLPFLKDADPFVLPVFNPTPH
ncbi:MAG: nitrilase family protein [Flavihumibacter sp.]